MRDPRSGSVSRSPSSPGSAGEEKQDEEVSVRSLKPEPIAKAGTEPDRWSIWTATSTLHNEETDGRSQARQDGEEEDEDEDEEDAILDAILASSSLALQSAQEALQRTLSDRKQLAQFRVDENASELLMGKREVELLTQLEANRQMTEYVEQRTCELQTLLKGSTLASFPRGPRRNPSCSTSTGGWKLGTATGDPTVEAAAQLSSSSLEGGVKGIVEAPQDQGVTMGKSAARRLEKMLGQHKVRSNGGGSDAGAGSSGSDRPSLGGRRDAQSMLASLSAVSSTASPQRSTSTSTAAEGPRRPSSAASPFGFPSTPYSPQRAGSSSHLSVRSSSGVSTITAASFQTARSASSPALPDVSGEQMEELLDDEDSSRARALDAPDSPSPSSSTSPSSPGPSRRSSYSAEVPTMGTRTSSRSSSPTSTLLSRRQQLHRSHPSAPAVVSTRSSTSATSSSSLWSPGLSTAYSPSITSPSYMEAPMASTSVSTSGIIPQRRPSPSQRRTVSASGPFAFSYTGPGGRIARASAVPSLSPATASSPSPSSRAVLSSQPPSDGTMALATKSTMDNEPVVDSTDAVAVGKSARGWGLGSWITFGGTSAPPQAQVDPREEEARERETVT
ncbi:hypothetical protein BCV69DRAFT_284321 [Microstroma glucosiphilum]|uniref:Uncharacterized protein n=1 Tax=Pseudomicrostroma glucosiphilum TaxID=1684307 RepID=A0A316U198_9BASI|nr:hypothetical protein BCV69DRAFT_284321 [Pseudomicrostroma glucosiphilum]PWN19162.1 hypothetical protein BCV69DRAFT_284321 [Pseudomicrostroma glucosiphilum]